MVTAVLVTSSSPVCTELQARLAACAAALLASSSSPSATAARAREAAARATAARGSASELRRAASSAAAALFSASWAHLSEAATRTPGEAAAAAASRTEWSHSIAQPATPRLCQEHPACPSQCPVDPRNTRCNHPSVQSLRLNSCSHDSYTGMPVAPLAPAPKLPQVTGTGGSATWRRPHLFARKPGRLQPSA
ncbi:hypothetical protein PG988_011684 [Apiospora saccharicola]